MDSVDGPAGGTSRGSGVPARRELVVAHFPDGRSAARAVGDLEARGVAVDELYVVAGREAGLLARIGVAAADVRRAAAEAAAVVVVAAVGDDQAGDCLAVLSERAEAIGVPAAA